VAEAAGGGVGMLALPLLATEGSADPLEPVQAARNAATPARAEPCRNRRRVRAGLMVRRSSVSLIDSPSVVAG
jgi:hypothetical protein